jgi:flagellar biosynthesis protein FlhB
MAGQQQALDANEPATPFKLEKAHERGSIVRSAEVNFAVALVACVACVEGLGSRTMAQAGLLIGQALRQASSGDLTLSSALARMGHDGTQAALLVAPILFVVWVSVSLAGAFQAGGVFTAAPLVPDFSRINPAAGIQRLFSLRSLNELWRSVAKIAVIALAMMLWTSLHLGELLGLSSRTARATVLSGLHLVGSALTLLAAVVVAFALLDWSLNRREFMRKMRMSKREIKDERKERDGDPRIKSRLRELRIEWLRKTRQLSQVRNADVLLTNPTHYAVALEYRHGEMAAPMITARGAGELAQRMRLQARRNDVPVVEKPSLARALFALSEAQVLVPQEHFEEVARILRWVFAARAARASRGSR